MLREPTVQEPDRDRPPLKDSSTQGDRLSGLSKEEASEDKAVEDEEADEEDFADRAIEDEEVDFADKAIEDDLEDEEKAIEDEEADEDGFENATRGGAGAAGITHPV